MRKLFAVIAFVTGAAAVATPALAAIDVDLAFTPSTAAPFSTVTLFVSIANTGATPVQATIGVSIASGGFSLGPVHARLSLAAGQERSREVRFLVPPLRSGTQIALTLTGSAGGSTDTATATLTVGSNAATGSTDAALRQLPGDVVSALGASPTPVQAPTFGAVKALYR